MGAAAAHTDTPGAESYPDAFHLDFLHAFPRVPRQAALYRFVLLRNVVVVFNVYTVEVVRLVRHREFIGQRVEHDLWVVNMVEGRAAWLISDGDQ
ncbi:hypothetical protein D3C85_1066520 [compost metagenome]